MGWNEMEVAREKHAKQAAAAAVKSTGKRGRKRRGTAEGEQQAKVARLNNLQEKVQIGG
jgi:hypothetical protein